jgi:hypothetical protein
MFGIDATTRDDFRRRFIRSRLIRLTLAVAAAACLVTPTASRASGQIDYTLSNVTAVFDGTPVSISAPAYLFEDQAGRIAVLNGGGVDDDPHRQPCISQLPGSPDWNSIGHAVAATWVTAAR